MAHYGADHSRWETYPLASDMNKADALAYWPEDETFVIEKGDEPRHLPSPS